MTLGLGGVLIVLVSVFSAVGFYGYVGVPCTMLIIEVRMFTSFNFFMPVDLLNVSLNCIDQEKIDFLWFPLCLPT